MSVFLIAALACCVAPVRAVPLPPPDLPVISTNDNREPAGKLERGVLTLSLEARTGMWYPEGPGGRSLEVAAFAEVGKPLLNPGPLIRVPVGTWVEASVRNSLDKPLTLYGFGAERRGIGDSVIIAAGETRTVRFQASTAGTFYYAGSVTPGPLAARLNDGTQLNGVIIVNPPGAARDDRTFVISWWFTLDSLSPSGLGRGIMVINGLSWPHTEELAMTQGDSAHWRFVNLTGVPHPMHLHGFYFSTDAKGDGIQDTVYAPASRRMAVTELVMPGQTMALSWQASRPGDWIFHCHFAGHLSKLVSLDTYRGELDSSAAAHHMSDEPHQMYGLVLGIRVAPSGTPAMDTAASRPIRILVREKAGVYGANPGYAFVLGGSADDASGAMPVPGPTLVLQRGQRVAVTIVNNTMDHAAIHWHGIELEDSYADGVPGWSGNANRRLPAIAPGDSLTVHFTPPRVGTFMYHSHFNEFQQIPSGLYGVMLVEDNPNAAASVVDRIAIFSDRGPITNVISGPFPPVAMNGDSAPPPMRMRAGQSYRFRLINIRGDRELLVSLTGQGGPVQWRAVAKDGADLPASQQASRPATLFFAPGEIYDFEFTPATTGPLTFQFGDPPDPTPGAPPPKVTNVAVVVE